MDIGLNTFSIRREADELAKNVDDLPKAIINLCNDVGIKRVELFDRHFRKENLGNVKKQFDDVGIDFFALGAHCKALVPPNMVDKRFEEYKEWLELAHTHEIPYIRFQMDSGDMEKCGDPPASSNEKEMEDYMKNIDRAIEQVEPSITKLQEILDNYNAYVGLETHGSFSSNYLFLEKFEKKFSHKQIKWIYDIGNYSNENMRFKALDVVKNNIWYLHAATYSFDKKGLPSGGRKDINYPRAVKVLKEVGFDGTWSIEYKGKNGLVGVHQATEYINYSYAVNEGKDYSIKTKFPKNKRLLKKYRV